jgi:hypothetical protein
MVMSESLLKVVALLVLGVFVAWNAIDRLEKYRAQKYGDAIKSSHNLIDTTIIIKKLAVLNIAFILIGLIFSFQAESMLPYQLRQYVELINQSANGVTVLEAFKAMFALLLIISWLCACAGLLMTKIWAKNLYILTIAVAALLSFMPPYDPVIEPYFVNIVFEVTSIISGGMICLLLFSKSSFQQLLLEPKNIN